LLDLAKLAQWSREKILNVDLKHWRSSFKSEAPLDQGPERSWPPTTKIDALAGLKAAEASLGSLADGSRCHEKSYLRHFHRGVGGPKAHINYRNASGCYTGFLDFLTKILLFAPSRLK